MVEILTQARELDLKFDVMSSILRWYENNNPSTYVSSTENMQNRENLAYVTVETRRKLIKGYGDDVLDTMRIQGLRYSNYETIKANFSNTVGEDVISRLDQLSQDVYDMVMGEKDLPEGLTL